MRKIICIDREYGSNGRIIGKELARRLNINFYDHELIEKATNMLKVKKDILMKIDEKKHRPLLFETLFIDNDHTLGSDSINDILFECQKRLIIEYAQKNDCIFIGRCAADILRENTDYRVVNLFITAPLEFRIKNRMKIEDKSKEEIIEIVKRKDKERQAYYEYHTGKDWSKPYNYDVILNSESLGIERTIAVLTEAFKKMEF